MEKERVRIAQDMHDEIGSKLTRISFLSELAKTVPRVPAAAQQPLDGISQASRELLATLDELVWAVNPRNDSLEQLASYLAHYAGDYFQTTAIDCRLNLPPQLPTCILTSEVRHNLFLAFEETLNNVLKHSKAAGVEIRMFCREGAFEIRVADNGRGFKWDPAGPATSAGSPRQSNGLGNLRQRLADIGGDCQIASQPGQGTTVHLVLPLPPASSSRP